MSQDVVLNNQKMEIITENTTKHFDAYLKALRKICPKLNDKEIDFMFSNISLISLKPKELYLKAGKVQDSLAFCCKGLLRIFCINDKGMDVTVAFVKENNYATDYGAFISQTPSKYFIETLEPCLLIDIPFTSIQESYSKYKTCENYGRVIAENHLIKVHNRVDEFLFNSAEQRYINFLSENAEVMSRISVTHLSSFLGMKRQTLTRIRKKMIQKNNIDTNVSPKDY